MMTYTNDARIVSSNVKHHHDSWAQEQLVGNEWQEARYTCKLQAYEAHPKMKNLITQAKGTVGSMWHSPPGSLARPRGGCFI